MNPKILQEIEELISEDNTEKAIKQLNDRVSRRHLGTKVKLLLLSSRFHRLEDDRRKGVISSDEYSVSRNKVNEALLFLVRDTIVGSRLGPLMTILFLSGFCSCALLLISFLISPEGVVIGQPKLLGKWIVYDIYVFDEHLPNYAVFVKINDKDTSEYKLDIAMKIISLPDSEIVNDTETTNKYKQKIIITFKQKGHYQLEIPLSHTPENPTLDFFKIVTTDFRTDEVVNWSDAHLYHFLFHQASRWILGLIIFLCFSIYFLKWLFRK